MKFKFDSLAAGFKTLKFKNLIVVTWLFNFINVLLGYF